MTDIVEKLRIWTSPRNPSRIMDKATITEAADEIERLWTVLSYIQWHLNGRLTDEALRNLRTYVDRHAPQTQPVNKA